MLAPMMRGLGFGVGLEPLPALFASKGCTIVATDQSSERAQAGSWASTDEHCSSSARLNTAGICPDDLFSSRVSFRAEDMNAISDDLTDFDFTWSSCAFEHLGSLEAGLRFLLRQSECLKPGGWAVHTTEFNVFSDAKTWTSGSTVLYRRRDLDALRRAVGSSGLEIEAFDFSLGDLPNDWFIDHWPYHDEPHLKLLVADELVTTSIVLVLRKVGGTSAPREPILDVRDGITAPVVDGIPTKATPSDETAVSTERLIADRDAWRRRYEQIFGTDDAQRSLEILRLEQTCRHWRNQYERIARVFPIKQALWLRRRILGLPDPSTTSE